METILRFKGIAVIVAAALLASCAGQGPGNPPTRGTLMRIDQDPTLQATRDYLKIHPFHYVKKIAQNGCGGMLAVARSAQLCINPTPTPPNFNWTYSFISAGGGFTTTYGNYSGHVSGGGSLSSCANDTAKQLAEDATALAGSLSNLAAKWQSDPNAAQLEDLLAGYAAGEIGAAAFIAGVVSLDAVAAGIAVAAIGLTLWSIVNIANCMSGGSATSYAMGRRRSA